jgi:hypothetical protein
MLAACLKIVTIAVLLFVIDAHVCELPALRVRALCGDGEDAPIVRNNANGRCHHFTALAQRGLNCIRGGQVRSNRVSPIRPLARDGITLSVQVGGPR